MTRQANRDLMRETVLRRSGGQCECMGECGHNHRWVADVPVQRCRAPHACQVQRKQDHPTFWVLAGTKASPMAYPEFYNEKRILIELEVVSVAGPSPDRREENFKALCQRCRLLMEQRRAPATVPDGTKGQTDGNE
jgi:hypothetical protein